MFAFLRRKKRREWLESQPHWLGPQPEMLPPEPEPEPRRVRSVMLAVLIVMLLAGASWARGQVIEWQQQRAVAAAIATGTSKDKPDSANDAPATTHRADSFSSGGGASTPEPSTFVLCGIGAAGLLVAALRRRKA